MCLFCFPRQVARTEKVQNCLSPKFAKKFVIDYYFEMVQKLIFGLYDIDNKTVDLSDDDFLGQLEITLGQVGRGRGAVGTQSTNTLSLRFGGRSFGCPPPPSRLFFLCEFVRENVGAQGCVVQCKAGSSFKREFT